MYCFKNHLKIHSVFCAHAFAIRGTACRCLQSFQGHRHRFGAASSIHKRKYFAISSSILGILCFVLIACFSFLNAFVAFVVFIRHFTEEDVIVV